MGSAGEMGGLDEAEVPWEFVHDICEGALAYLVNQLRKLKLAKVIRSTMKIYSRGSGFHVFFLGIFWCCFFSYPSVFLCFGVFNVFYPSHDAYSSWVLQFSSA